MTITLIDHRACNTRPVQLGIAFKNRDVKKETIQLIRTKPDEAALKKIRERGELIKLEFLKGESRKDCKYAASKNPSLAEMLAELRNFLDAGDFYSVHSKYTELRKIKEELERQGKIRKNCSRYPGGQVPRHIAKNFRFTELSPDEKAAAAHLAGSFWLEMVSFMAKNLADDIADLEATPTILIAKPAPPTEREILAAWAEKNGSKMLADEVYRNCRSLVKWKLALAAFELQEAAEKTVNSDIDDAKKETSRKTLELLQAEEIAPIAKTAGILKKFKTDFTLDGGRILFRPDDAQETRLQFIANDLWKASGGKLARKISYLSTMLTYLRTGNVDELVGFWEKYLPDRKEGKRKTGEKTRQCASELLHDGWLKRMIEEIKAMPRRLE